jgi:glycosyltransferase involved in cell wall biosynthesis
MRVSIVIHSKLPVKGYGGSERAAFWLGKELAVQGHKVTFVCQATGPIHFARTRAWNFDSKLGFDKQLESSIEPGSDMVHFFSKPEGTPRRPYLVTIEGNGKAGETFHPNTVFVSRKHAERHGWTEFVYNGLPLELYPLFPGPKKNQLLFLAKAKWRVKNLRGAVELARASHMPLRICGGEKPWYKLPTQYERYLGMVDGREKLRELGEAKALLFPVQWHEPFGIAVIEALAVGTPVFASPWGSLPEIVNPECGSICHSREEFLQAISQADSYDPRVCRKRVEEFFSAKKMANNYVAVYEKILRSGSLREGHPVTPPNQQPEEL